MDEQNQMLEEEQSLAGNQQIGQENTGTSMNQEQPMYNTEVPPQGQPGYGEGAAPVQPGYSAEVQPQVQSGYGTPISSLIQPEYGMPPVPPVPPQVQQAPLQVQSGYGMPPQGQQVPPQMQSGYGMPPGYGMPLQGSQVQSGYGMPPQGQQVPPQMQSGYGMLPGYEVPPQLQQAPPQVPSGYGMPSASQSVPPQGQISYQTFQPYGNAGKNTESTSLAIASMVLGIVSIVVCSWYVVGLGCGITGLILGCVYRAKGGTNGMSIAGIVCSSVGLSLGLLMMFDLMVEFF